MESKDMGLANETDIEVRDQLVQMNEGTGLKDHDPRPAPAPTCYVVITVQWIVRKSLNGQKAGGCEKNQQQAYTQLFYLLSN